MKPQDIIVLIKLHIWEKGRWKIASLADSIFLSQSETHAAIKRLEKSELFDPVTERPIRDAMEEFLIHGLKYCFPAERGTETRGLPTAHSAFPMNKLVVSKGSEVFVWPFPEGKTRGLSIKPLYKTAPQAASADPKMYEYLSLIDSLRVGRTRERNIAKEEITKRIRGEG